MVFNIRDFLVFIIFILISCNIPAGKSIVHEEIKGFLEVEAEDFENQELTDIRKWYLIDADHEVSVEPDGDGNHYTTASGQAYLEILPDTRRTHEDTLLAGENFSNEPGKLGVLNYKVKINNPGNYYVWVRAFSTGTEDNGLHVGLNGEWVESGQRMQWCEDKDKWTWASKQRMPEEHCGIEERIYLEIKEPGIHTISFSMREDGFEFDKWVISKEYHFKDGKDVY